MATKVAKSIGVAVGLVVVQFLVAGRRIGELSGYARATADTTVEGLTDSLPQEIRDRKIDHDIKAARLDLIDRQVQLNLSQGQIQQLQKDVEQLQASVGRRQRLLSEAYPVLKRAVAKKEADVQFAGTKFTMRDFQREVDDLMSQQDRETRQLKIKQDGLARLEKSVADGDRAISEMRSAMESSEQEVAVLKARRQQAEVESTTLDMIASVTANGQSTGGAITDGLGKLKQDVELLEARNEARREMTPVAEREPSNRLGKSWNRLEELKKYHERETSDESDLAVDAKE